MLELSRTEANMTIILGLLALLALLLLGAARAAERASELELEDAEPFTLADPRCRAVARRLEAARDAMRARGTPLLLVNRRAWTRESGNVISMRRV